MESGFSPELPDSPWTCSIMLTTPDQRRPPWLATSFVPWTIWNAAGCPTSDSRSRSKWGERAQTEIVNSVDTPS